MPGVLDWSQILVGVRNLAGSPADANHVEEQQQASAEPRRSIESEITLHTAPRAQPRRSVESDVAEAPWSVAEWAVALRFDNPRATVLVLLLG